MNKQAGFTLTELLITVTVIGVLAALATPLFEDFIRNERLTAKANEMLSTLYYARTEAVKRNRRVTVCKSENPGAAEPTCNTTATPGWESGWIVFVDGSAAVAGNGTREAGELLLRANEALGNDLELEPLAASPTISGYVSFTPRGTARQAGVGGVAQQGVFRLCDGRGIEFARAIELFPTGRARVLGPDDGAATAFGGEGCP